MNFVPVAGSNMGSSNLEQKLCLHTWYSSLRMLVKDLWNLWTPILNFESLPDPKIYAKIFQNFEFCALWRLKYECSSKNRQKLCLHPWYFTLKKLVEDFWSVWTPIVNFGTPPEAKIFKNH